MSYLGTACGNSPSLVKAIAEQLHQLSDTANIQAELCRRECRLSEVREDVPNVCHKEVRPLCWQHSKSDFCELLFQKLSLPLQRCTQASA